MQKNEEKCAKNEEKLPPLQFMIYETGTCASPGVGCGRQIFIIVEADNMFL